VVSHSGAAVTAKEGGDLRRGAAEEGPRPEVAVFGGTEEV